MDSDSLKAFLEDLQAQLGLYRDMLGVNASQLALLSKPEESDPDALLNLVSEKQVLMERIGQLEARLGPLKQSWNTSKAALPESIRTFADGLLGELSKTIEELISQEDATHRRLEEVMSHTREGINTIRKKAQVNKAYAAYGGGKPGASRFLDRRGEED